MKKILFFATIAAVTACMCSCGDNDDPVEGPNVTVTWSVISENNTTFDSLYTTKVEYTVKNLETNTTIANETCNLNGQKTFDKVSCPCKVTVKYTYARTANAIDANKKYDITHGLKLAGKTSNGTTINKTGWCNGEYTSMAGSVVEEYGSQLDGATISVSIDKNGNTYTDY